MKKRLLVPGVIVGAAAAAYAVIKIIGIFGESSASDEYDYYGSPFGDPNV